MCKPRPLCIPSLTEGGQRVRSDGRKEKPQRDGVQIVRGDMAQYDITDFFISTHLSSSSLREISVHPTRKPLLLVPLTLT